MNVLFIKIQFNVSNVIVYIFFLFFFFYLMFNFIFILHTVMILNDTCRKYNFWSEETKAKLISL